MKIIHPTIHYTRRLVELPYNDSTLTSGNTAYNVNNADIFEINGLSSAIVLCTELRTDIINHLANATRHISGLQSTAAVGAAPINLTTLLATAGTLLTAYAAHNADVIKASAWQYHDAQDTTHALVSAVTPTTLAETITRLNDLKAKYNLHEAETTGHHSAGTVAADQTATDDAVNGLGQDTDFGVPAGTPVDGQEISFRIRDDGTPRNLTWNSIFRAGTTPGALPAATDSGKFMVLGFLYNDADVKWDYVSAATVI